MPILDGEELTPYQASQQQIAPYLGSADAPTVNTNLGKTESLSDENYGPAPGGLKGDAFDAMMYGAGENRGFNAPAHAIQTDELLANKRYNVYDPTQNNENVHGLTQGFLPMVGNAAVNLVAKAAAYTVQNAGFILGAPVAAATQDLSNMTDNFLVKAGDALKEGVEASNPIYKRQSFTDGSIWHKLVSSEWWADDAVDRLALTAATLIPGMAASRGLGLARIAGAGLEAIADNPENYGWLGQKLLPRIYKAAADGTVDAFTNPALKAYAQGLTKAELYSWNIVGQSALNAKETQEGIKKTLTEMRDRGENTLSDDAIRQKAAEGGKRSFWETVPLTLAGSMVELPQLFSTAQGAKSVLNQLYSKETGELLEKGLATSAPSLLKTTGKALLTGLEHGQNESLQVAISRYNEDRAAGKDTRGSIPGILGDFLDNINDPNGQNNIALGTIQGILTTAGGYAKDRYEGKDTKEAAQKASLYDYIQKGKLDRRFFNMDFTARDESGKPLVDGDGKVQLDQKKLAEAGVSLAGIQQTLQRKAQAIHEGDFLSVREMEHTSLANLAYHFFTDPSGKDHLEALLKIEARDAKANPERINDRDELGNEITPDDQLQHHLETVNQLKKAYDAVDQRHAGFTDLQIDPSDSEKVKAGQQFLDGHKAYQYQVAAEQLFLKRELDKSNTAVHTLALENGMDSQAPQKIEDPSNPSEQELNDHLDDNHYLNYRYEVSKIKYKQAINKDELRAAFKEDGKQDIENPNPDRKKSRTTKAPPNPFDSETRRKFKGDTRSYKDLVSQYGEGEQSQRDVLHKLANSPHATTREKTLARHFLELSDKKDTIVLGDRRLEASGIYDPATGKTHINYEDNASDYEGGHRPFETILLHELGHKYTVKGLDSDPAFKKQVADLYDLTQAYVKENKEAIDKAKGSAKPFYAFKQYGKDADYQEFVTEALSNPRFQALLAKIPHTGTEKTAWTTFLDSVKSFLSRLLGIKGDSVLDELVGTITNQIDTSHPSFKAEIEAEEAELAKKAALLKQVSEVIKTAFSSGGSTLGTEGIAETPKESPKKHLSKLFSATTFGTDHPRPHQLREVRFLSVADFHPRRKQMRRLLVTANNEAGLGLSGLTHYLMQGDSTYQALSQEKQDVFRKDAGKGPLAVVYVRQDEKGNHHFLDEKGADLSPVGSAADLEKIVTGTLPGDSLYWSEKYNKDGKATTRYQDNHSTEEEAKLWQQAWQSKRKELFTLNDQSNPATTSLVISRGIPARTKTAEGKSERNAVVGTLIPKEHASLLLTQPDLVKVSTVGTIEHNGESIPATAGQVFFSYRSTLEFLNNRKFNKGEATTVADVLQLATRKLLNKEGFDPQLKDFLSGLLYLGKPTNADGSAKEVLDNSVYFEANQWHFGKTGPVIGFTQLADAQEGIALKAAIADYLQGVFANVNNFKLTQQGGDAFEEITRVDADGKLTVTKWPSYQAYLLDAKDGRDVPLTTGIRQLDSVAEAPHNYTNRYSWSPELLSSDVADLKKQEVPKVQETPKPEVPVIPQAAPVTTSTTATTEATEEVFHPQPKGTVIHLDGTENTYTTKDGTAVRYKVEGEGIQVLNTAPGRDKAALQEAIQAFIVATFNKQAAPAETTVEAKTEAAPAPVVETTPAAVVEQLNPDDLEARATERMRKAKERLAARGEKKEERQFRLLRDKDEAPIKDTDKEVVEFIKARTPFSVRVVNQLIKVSGGGYAVGSYLDGVISIYQNAGARTPGHEVFEGVFQAFTTNSEKRSLQKEFTSKQGTFYDRESGKQVPYKSATSYQVKEALAEGYAQFALTGELPFKEKASLIHRLFQKLRDWAHWLLTGTNRQTIRDLFQKIEAGYYKNTPLSSLPGEAQYKKVPGFDETDSNSIIKGVTSKVFRQLFVDGRSLTEFDEQPFSVGDLFDRAFQAVQDDLDEAMVATGSTQLATLAEKLEIARPAIQKLTLQYLQTFKIVTKEDAMDKESETEDNDYNGGAEAYLQDPFLYDGRKNAAASVRLLFATIIESEWTSKVTGRIQSKRDSATYMEEMVESGKLFNQTLSELEALNNPEAKEAQLRELAREFPNYRRLAERLSLYTQQDLLTPEDWKLRLKLFSTFSKQRPIAMTMVEDGEHTFMREENASDARNRLTTGWVDGMKVAGKLITFNESLNTYTVNKAAVGGVLRGSGPEHLAFLGKLGIDFDPATFEGLSEDDRKSFREQVAAIQDTLSKRSTVAGSAKALGIQDRLKNLANLYIKGSGNATESTFMLDGVRRQEFVQKNTLSHLVNKLNSATSLSDEGLEYLSQPWAGGSVYVTPATIASSQLFQVAYLAGTQNTEKDRYTQTEKLGEAPRLVQEINANFKHFFYALVPADSKTEWMLKVKPLFSFKSLHQEGFWSELTRVFNGYYAVEKKLYEGEKAQYGKGNDRILAPLSPGYAKEALSEADLQTLVAAQVSEIRAFLTDHKVLSFNPEQKTYALKGLDTDFTAANGLDRNALSEQELESVLRLRTANYMINNVEMMKLFFGDPAAYGNIPNVLKRVKTFGSPRETSFHNSAAANAHLTATYNKSGETPMLPGDFGYRPFSDVMKTVTLADVLVDTQSITGDKHLPSAITKAYGDSNATDAQSHAPLSSYREIAMKRGYAWSDAKESLYQYIMARDRQAMLEDGKLVKEAYREELQKADKALVAQGIPNHETFSVLKPVGSGYTGEGKAFLDKTSVFPMTYTALRGTNLADHYVAMTRNNIAYAIMDSGRKLGAPLDEKGKKTFNAFYDDKGSPNTDYQNLITIPFEYYGIQVETSGEHDTNTIGSQLSKLAEVNVFSHGVPSDFETEVDGKKVPGTITDWVKLDEAARRDASLRYDDAVHSKEVREAMVQHGYEELLHQLGIKEVEKDGEKVPVVNKAQVARLLQKELFRREVPDNIRESLSVDKETGEWTVPLEALNNYQQVKNILYSYVNKHIARTHVSGGPKVQVSGSGFEAAGYRVEARKDSKGNPVYTSSGLKFYEATYDANGKVKEVARMEVLLPAWFRKELSRSGVHMTDSELITHLNSGEGKEVLEGIGFRIPTQEMNSVEAFVVKGFLPDFHGDTVVVPEAITTKAGSDFDVDKLNTYLKSVYVDHKGAIKAVPYFGTGEEAKRKLGELLTAQLLARPVKANADALDNLDSEEMEGDSSALNRLYKQSLENEYFRVLGRQVLHPENYQRLVRPNSADTLKKISEDLEAIAPSEFGSVTPSLLSALYLSKMRHEFLISKSGVGVAALHQSNNALNQKAGTFYDPERIESLKDATEKGDIQAGGSDIKLPHNQVTVNGRVLSALSGMKDVAGQYISDGISSHLDGFVDAAKGAWIAKIIQGFDLIGTHLTLRQLGVSEKTTAFFMNQPIIREFVKRDARRGEGEFRDHVIKGLEQSFPLGRAAEATDYLAGTSDDTKLSNALKGNIRDYYTGIARDGRNPLTDAQNAEQRFILKEFLKYKAIGENMRRLIQGSVYDTTSFTDVNLFELKEHQYADARDNNVFSSVDKLLTTSFIGEVRQQVGRANAAISGSLFQFDAPSVRHFIQPLLSRLRTYVRGTDSYLRASRKVEQSFISYLVQNSTRLNGSIATLLRNEETAITTQLAQLKSSLKGDIVDNLVLQALTLSTGNAPADTKNVALFNKAADVFTSNLYTDALRSLKANEHTRAFYGNLLRAAYLQAGQSLQNNSFSDIIPNEDFRQFILPAIRSLVNEELLSGFVDTGAFYRNNWNNTDIVPRINEKWDTDDSGAPELRNKVAPSWLTTTGAPFAYTVSSKSPKSTAPYLTVQRTIPGFKGNVKEMVKNGDFSFRQTILMRRMEDSSGNAVLIKDKAYFIPVYAQGDGVRAQEYYNTVQPTVLNNHTFVPPAEVSNEALVKAYNKSIMTTNIANGGNTPVTRLQMQPDNIAKIKAGSKTLTIRTYKLSDGVHALPDGTPINVKLLGNYKVLNGRLFNLTTSQEMNKDEFAKGEGFKDWKDFELNAMFSANFINGKQERYLYSLSLTQQSNESAIQQLKQQGIIKRDC